jgi:hypothetical protein
MPRIRTIKPKFWDNLQVARLSRDARLLFVGMWNFTDDLGVILADPMWIKAKVLPYDNVTHSQVNKWLEEIAQQKFTYPIQHGSEQFLYIPGIRKHQVINRPNYSEVFIEKPQLEALIAEIGSHHVLITDSLGTDRNGKEGNGKEGKGREGKGNQGSPKVTPPTLQEVKDYFIKNGYPETLAIKAFNFYNTAADENTGQWKDSRGQKIINWKQKMIGVWFKEENKGKSIKNDTGTAINNF